MALLPNLFRDTDIPLTLGAKVVPVTAVQLTPEEVFAKKDHSLDVFLVDQCAAALMEGVLGRLDDQVTFSSEETKVLSEHHQVYATFGLEENLANLSRLRKDELLTRLITLIDRAESLGFAPARDMLNAPDCFTNMQIRLSCEHWGKRLTIADDGDAKWNHINRLKSLSAAAGANGFATVESRLMTGNPNKYSAADFTDMCTHWENKLSRHGVIF